MQCTLFLSILLALGGQTLASPISSGSTGGHFLNGRGVRGVSLIQRQEVQQAYSDYYDASGANTIGGAAVGADAPVSVGLNAGLDAGAALQTGVGLAGGILGVAANVPAGVGLAGGILGVGANVPAGVGIATGILGVGANAPVGLGLATGVLGASDDVQGNSSTRWQSEEIHTTSITK